jgi:hypothetical protein
MNANQAMNALGMAGNLANQQASNQIGATGTLSNLGAQLQQNLLGAAGGMNNAQVQNQGNINAANSAASNTRMGQQADAIGGLLNAAGPGLSSVAGMIGNVFKGGSSGAVNNPDMGLATIAPKNNQQMPAMAHGGPVPAGPASSFGRLAMASGGKVPALVSPGEVYLPPKAVAQVQSGKSPTQVGEKIPGKAAITGPVDSYKNDTVHKKLDVGGVVIPRSVTQGKDVDAKARAFVAAVMGSKGKGLPKK